MNKYQEALHRVCWSCDEYSMGACEHEHCAVYVPIKELIDKATNEKPYLEGDGYADGEMVYDIWICPNCGKEYEFDYDGKHNYCPQCGQHLDWSEDDE